MKCSKCCTRTATAVKKIKKVFYVLCDECERKLKEEAK